MFFSTPSVRTAKHIIEKIENHHTDHVPAPPRYSATVLSGFLVCTNMSRRQFAIAVVDYNRHGSGVVIDAPIFEKDDEVRLTIWANDKPELKLHAMPASVRYRIGWEGKYRIGLEFLPHNAFDGSDRLVMQSLALEAYLVERSEPIVPATQGTDFRNRIRCANDSDEADFCATSTKRVADPTFG